MAEFGNFFKQIRESKGLTLRDVERETGVSNAYLSQLESEKIKQPSPTTLHKLAEFYKVSYSEMMTKVGYPSPTVGGTTNVLEKKIAYGKLGKITSDEEEELVEYLKLIRKRRQK